MRRVLAYLLTSLLSLTLGALIGARFVSLKADRELGHDVVFGLMNDGLAAREIYRGQSRQYADRLRDGFPQRVLGVEKFWREDGARNSAFRVVRDAYESSGTEVPAEIKQLLLTVPPRPIREVPAPVK